MPGAIPKSFIDELLSRTNIVEVVNGRVSLKKAGKDFQGLCPFHDEKTPSFTVSPAKNMFYCFGCGAGGDAIKFVQQFEGASFTEAVESLAASVGMDVPRQGSGAPERDLRPLHEAMQAAEGYYRAQLKATPAPIDYLKGRGLTGASAQEFGLGFAPDAWDALCREMAGGARPISSKTLLEAGLIAKNEQGREYDRFRCRIMFPVRDTKGRVIAFGGRLLGEGRGPKYLNSPETPIFSKSRELYGLFEARRSTRRLEALILVEGYMDVIALAQAGIRNVVATLGTATGEAHYRKLYRYADEVICCFDGDQAGHRAAWKALESALGCLSAGKLLKFVLLPEGEDPDTLVRREGADAFRRRLAKATPAVEHLFNGLRQGLDLAARDDRARFVDLAMPYIERIPADGALRRMMQSELEALAGVDGEPGRSASAKAPPGRSPGKPRGAPSRSLCEKLLALLLQSPQLAAQLAPETVDALVAMQEGELFGEVLRYAAENGGIDSAHLLGRWSGQPGHAELVALHQRPTMLDDAGMALEFGECVERLLALAQRRRRARLLQEMRDDPAKEKEKLAEFMELRRSAEA